MNDLVIQIILLLVLIYIGGVLYRAAIWLNHLARVCSLMLDEKNDRRFNYLKEIWVSSWRSWHYNQYDYQINKIMYETKMMYKEQKGDKKKK